MKLLVSVVSNISTKHRATKSRRVKKCDQLNSQYRLSNKKTLLTTCFTGILNLLSVEGITEAKLEGLSCYGSNVLVLIQAQVVMGTRVGEGERRVMVGRSSRELPTFKIGRRIIQRAQWRSVHIHLLCDKKHNKVIPLNFNNYYCLIFCG